MHRPWGVDINQTIADALSSITSEALDRAPDDLPFYVNTPIEVERWLGWLQRSWAIIPGMVDALDQAMNQNRQRNAKWFQDHGYGGH